MRKAAIERVAAFFGEGRSPSVGSVLEPTVVVFDVVFDAKTGAFQAGLRGGFVVVRRRSGVVFRSIGLKEENNRILENGGLLVTGERASEPGEEVTGTLRKIDSREFPTVCRQELDAEIAG